MTTIPNYDNEELSITVAQKYLLHIHKNLKTLPAAIGFNALLEIKQKCRPVPSIETEVTVKTTVKELKWIVETMGACDERTHNQVNKALRDAVEAGLPALAADRPLVADHLITYFTQYRFGTDEKIRLDALYEKDQL